MPNKKQVFNQVQKKQQNQPLTFQTHQQKKRLPIVIPK
jgi:hypothetical protein